MAKEPNYSAMNDSILDIISFCKQTLENEKADTEKRKEELKTIAKDLISKGLSVDSSLEAQIIAVENMIKTLSFDISTVTNLYDKIYSITQDSSMTPEEQNSEIQKEVKPFFETYGNDYTTDGDVEIKRGKSQFKNIMSHTKRYGKLQSKIDKLDESAAKLMVKRTVNNKDKITIREKIIASRIKRLKTKQTSINNKQRIIMFNRNERIQNRNAEVSVAKGRMDVAKAKKKDIMKKRLESLQDKDIKVGSSNLLLFKAGFKKKIINDEFKNWEEKALNDMKKNSKRKL